MKDQYLNYNKIKDFNEGSIKVKCYYNGLYWACPNPRDEYRSKGVEESYNKGFFTEYVTVKLTEEQFAYQNNWNS